MYIFGELGSVGRPNIQPVVPVGARRVLDYRPPVPDQGGSTVTPLSLWLVGAWSAQWLRKSRNRIPAGSYPVLGHR